MRKKRGYSREIPVELVRDYKLFAIACEGGKREPNYFKVFEHFSRRVSVDVIEAIVSDEEMQSKHQLRSAPRWVLDRAVAYIEREGLLDEDELWFVLDTDRWSFEQLSQINHYCERFPNWHIAISNPCFEVWLYFHKKQDIAASASQTCNEFKSEISDFAKGGYHELKFIGDLRIAIENARQADQQQNYFMPDIKVSKIYSLVENIMAFVGENSFNEFLDQKLPELIQAQVAKYTKERTAAAKSNFKQKPNRHK